MRPAPKPVNWRQRHDGPAGLALRQERRQLPRRWLASHPCAMGQERSRSQRRHRTRRPPTHNRHSENVGHQTRTRQSPGNIALVMSDDVIGIDVDHYGKKHGGDTLKALEARLGPLPTAVLSTARDDKVSGIRFYRVPAGRKWKESAGKRHRDRPTHPPLRHGVAIHPPRGLAIPLVPVGQLQPNRGADSPGLLVSPGSIVSECRECGDIANARRSPSRH
jgi:hypothetical protein